MLAKGLYPINNLKRARGVKKPGVRQTTKKKYERPIVPTEIYFIRIYVYVRGRRETRQSPGPIKTFSVERFSFAAGNKHVGVGGSPFHPWPMKSLVVGSLHDRVIAKRPGRGSATIGSSCKYCDLDENRAVKNIIKSVRMNNYWWERMI